MSLRNKFYNHPRVYSREAYESEIDAFVSHAGSCPDVAAIFQIGSVQAPGLSDIDLIVVVRDSFRPRGVLSVIAEAYKKSSRYLFTHTSIVVTQRLFPSLPLVVPIFDIQHLCGEPLDFSLEAQETAYLILHMINILTLFYPREFMSARSGRALDVRGTLCRLYHVNKMARMLEGITGKTTSAHIDFCERITTLRRDWFALGERRFALLSGILHDAVPVVLSIIDRLRAHVRSAGLIKVKDRESDNFFISSRQTIFFLQAWTESGAMSIMERCSRRGRIFASALPLEFMVLLSSLHDVPTLKRALHSCFRSAPPQFVTGCAREIARRLHAVNEQLNLVFQYGTPFMHLGTLYFEGLIRPGMFARAKASWKRTVARQYLEAKT